MKENYLYKLLAGVIVGVTAFILGWIGVKWVTAPEFKPPSEMIYVKLHYPEFLSEELNDSIMLLACEHFGLQEPRIVTAQAILETGWFTSKVFKEYNNPFGIYNSYINDYCSYHHWSFAILDYKKRIESRRKEGEDYYEFLERIGYATDKKYIDKVKQIERKLPP